MLEFAERTGVHVAVYAEEMFWRVTGSHVYMQDMTGPGWREVPSLLDALKTGAPTFIRFLGAPAVEAMKREFGDLPLTYLYETWHEFIECVVLSRNANKKNAFGKCVSQKAKAKREAQDEKDAAAAERQTNAAHECAAERSADKKAFEDKYGTNHNKKNAFGKCVSQKAREDGEGTPDDGS